MLLDRHAWVLERGMIVAKNMQGIICSNHEVLWGDALGFSRPAKAGGYCQHLGVYVHERKRMQAHCVGPVSGLL